MSNHGAPAGSGGWRRSSWCSTNSCVEVALTPRGDVAVSDSKRSGSGSEFVLVFTPAEWEAFLAGAVHGEFTLDALRRRREATEHAEA